MTGLRLGSRYVSTGHSIDLENDLMTRLYVYKCRNNPNTEYSAFGNWEDVFAVSEPTRWGGSWATENAMSIRIFEEELKATDLVLAWQTDKKAAIGVAEVVGFEDVDEEVTFVDEREDGSVVETEEVMSFQHVLLQARERFPQPVRLHDLKKTTFPELTNVSALKQGNVATVYRTTPWEAHMLLKACNSRYAVNFEED
jgi:predicted RNA-binding protein with PUA-like domain